MALTNKRTGRISSSEGAVALMSNGKANDEPGAPFYTYVDECIMERFFQHSLENSVDVLAFSWGKLCEKIVHELLPEEYQFHSDITYEHPKYPEWVGTPDGSKEKERLLKIVTETVTDTKCPLTRKSFYQFIHHLYDFDMEKMTITKKAKIDGKEIMDRIRFGYIDEKGYKHAAHKDGEKFYWQLVSNACIMGARFAELIVFMPYFEDIETIKEWNRSLPSDEQSWLIERAKDGELPYIYKETGIERVNIIRFEVPEEDKKKLEMRVKLAIELINR